MTTQVVDFETYRAAIASLNDFCRLYGADTQDSIVFANFKDYCEQNGIDPSVAISEHDDLDECASSDGPTASCLDIDESLMPCFKNSGEYKEPRLMTIECLGEIDLQVIGDLNNEQMEQSFLSQIIEKLASGGGGEKLTGDCIYTTDSSDLSIDFLRENHDLIFHDCVIKKMVKSESVLRTKSPLRAIDYLLNQKKIKGLYEHHYKVDFSVRVTFEFIDESGDNSAALFKCIVNEMTPVLKSYGVGIDSSCLT